MLAADDDGDHLGLRCAALEQRMRQSDRLAAPTPMGSRLCSQPATAQARQDLVTGVFVGVFWQKAGGNVFEGVGEGSRLR